jgi:hypothetical protein
LGRARVRILPRAHPQRLENAMSRAAVSPRRLVAGLLAVLALGACTREEASDPALESDRSARAEADASERHPVAASQASGAGQHAPDSGDPSSTMAGRDPLDVLDPTQRDVPAPAEDPAIAAQAQQTARAEAMARCATLAPQDRSDCEARLEQGYAMNPPEDGLEDEDEDDASGADER